MKATTQLHQLGQRLWLDNISRDLLDSGTLKTYIDEFSVTGLTSNPTIFDQAIRSTAAYDNAIHKKVQEGQSGEGLFFELALEDLKRAALLFSSIHEATGGVDGWVSLEVSPRLVQVTSPFPPIPAPPLWGSTDRGVRGTQPDYRLIGSRVARKTRSTQCVPRSRA